MALTKGFKKLVGLVVVIAAVGGGLYYYKTMPKKAEQSVDLDQPAQQDPVIQPIQQQPQPEPQQVEQPTQQQAQPEPAPASEDASSNRGMQFLLNQGKK